MSVADFKAGAAEIKQNIEQGNYSLNEMLSMRENARDTARNGTMEQRAAGKEISYQLTRAIMQAQGQNPDFTDHYAGDTTVRVDDRGNAPQGNNPNTDPAVRSGARSASEQQDLDSLDKLP